MIYTLYFDHKRPRSLLNTILAILVFTITVISWIMSNNCEHSRCDWPGSQSNEEEMIANTCGVDEVRSEIENEDGTCSSMGQEIQEITENQDVILLRLRLISFTVPWIFLFLNWIFVDQIWSWSLDSDLELSFDIRVKIRCDTNLNNMVCRVQFVFNL